MGSVCYNCPNEISEHFELLNSQIFSQQIQSLIEEIRNGHKVQQKKMKNNSLPNDKLFRGILLNGKKNGYGELFAGNHAYFGMFQNDVPDGEGLMIRGMKDYVKGNFRKGKLNGEVREKVNKSQFNGQYFQGQKLKGILQTETYTYEGSFKKNKFDGQGVLSFKNGDKYKGNFKDGLYHGEGKYQTLQQGSYQGYFKNGFYDGKGIFKWKNDYYYQGDYRNGMRNGFGKFTMGNEHYEGFWVDGQPKNNSKIIKAEESAFKKTSKMK